MSTKKAGDYKGFLGGFSDRMLRSDVNPVCTCNGGYCYSKNANDKIEKWCENNDGKESLLLFE